VAMSTVLQAVTEQQIQALRREPDRVAALDEDRSFSTAFAASINHFLAGDAYPTAADHPLWPMLQGEESVACGSLENGEFGLVSPRVARRVADLLAAVDVAAVAERVGAADLGHDAELYDLELIDEAQAPAVIAAELRDLVAFYARVSSEGLGVVSYTT